MGKDSPSPPQAPDYAGAARAQGAANVEAARTQARMSNPNINSPYGNRVVTYGTGAGGANDVDMPTVTDTLSPIGQQRFDLQNQTQLGMGQLANQGIEQVRGALGSSFDTSGAPGQVTSLGQGTFQGGPAPTTYAGHGGQTGGSVGNYSEGTPSVGAGMPAPSQSSIDAVRVNMGMRPGKSSPAPDAPQYSTQSGGGTIPQVDQYTQDTTRAPTPTTSAGALNPSGGAIQGQINPQDYDRNQVINSLYGQQTSRLDPQWQQRDEAMRTQLANQGLAPGGEAYTNAMRDQTFARNDAYNSALNSAIGNATAQQQAQFGMAQGAGQFANQAQQQGYGQQLGNANLNLGAQQQAFGQQLAGAGLDLGAEQQAYGQEMGRGTFGLQGQQQQYGQQLSTAQASNQAEQARLAQQQAAGQFQNQARQQSIQEQAYARGLPLNEVSALMSGSQIQGPQFQPYSGTSVAPAPIFNAAQQQAQYGQNAYNSQQANQNAMTSGLFSLGGAAMQAFPWSDRRLKSNIRRLGTHPAGMGIYAFDIFGERTVGVMADEVLAVRPEAVIHTPSGYMQVDYGRLV